MNHRALSVLSFGHFAVDLTAGALPATLPLLQGEFHLSYLWLGLIMTTSGVTSSIMQPLFGIISDTAKARYFLPLGVLGALAGYSAVGTTHSYVGVLVFVAIMGLGSAIYHPEATKCAYAVSGALRTTGMSYFAVGGNLGVAFGPLIVSLIFSWIGLRGTWWFALPALAVAAWVASIIPTIALAQQRITVHERSRTAETQHSALVILILVGGLRATVYAGVLTFVPLYAVNVLHQPVAHNGVLLFTFLAAGALATLIAGPLADRYGVREVLTVSLAFVPFALALYLVAGGVLAWIGLALAGAFLIGTLSSTVVLGQQALPNRLGLASALMIGFTTGLGSLGVAALGKVADNAGLLSALWLLVGVGVLTFVLALALPSAARIQEWVESRALAGRHEA